MRLVQRSIGTERRSEVVLGVGLVGRRVAEALGRLPGSLLERDEDAGKVKWSVPGSLGRALESARRSLDGSSKVRVFWCAGKAGFASTREQCAAELESLVHVLRWTERLRADFDVEFHLTSSAGGLHEGQQLVESADRVRTHRPYAALKLAQEQALAAARLECRHVYRLSSVYDLPTPGFRLGLISTLVLNAVRRKPTLITAHAATQRDFIAAADVASYMTSEGRPAATGLHYLISGQPLTIGALQLAVERHLHRPISVVFTTGKDNFESTTFLPSLRPLRWTSSSVESNLARIVAAAQVYRRRS